MRLELSTKMLKAGRSAAPRDPAELEQRIAETVRGASTLPHLLRATVELVARWAGWPVGHVYMVDDRGVAISTGAWSVDDPDARRPFIRASERIVFQQGDGAVGRVVQRDDLIWIPDIEQDHCFLRRDGAREAGLRSYVAFPIAAGGETLGAIEFLAEEPIGLDGETSAVMERVGAMLARAIVRERAGEAIRLSKSFVRDVLAAAADAFIAMDTEGMVLEWNPQAEQLFGWSRGEAVGQPLAELIIPEDDRDAHHRGLDRFRRTGEGPLLHRKIEVEALHRSGGPIDVEITIWPVTVDGATVFSAFARSVSERRRIIQALRESERRLKDENIRSRAELEELRSLDALKNEILSTVSHELRTPLTSILGLAHTLQLWGPRLGDEQRVELADRIVANAKHLDELLADLIDVDRLKRGIIRANLQRADVGQLVRRVATRVTTMLNRRGITVDARGRLEAAVDPPKLERVVENLIVNAIKHTPAGTRVDVGVGRAGDEIEITVADAGPGIPDHEKRTIFEAFARGDGARGTPGSGLGLSLVARFVELHGGRVWVEDRDGGGAVFTVRLPASQVVDLGDVRGLARTASMDGHA